MQVIPVSNSASSEEELKHVSAWVEKNNLSLNLGTTMEIIFQSRRRKTVVQPAACMNIPRVANRTALGVNISEQMTFTDHIDVVLRSCASLTYSLSITPKHDLTPARCTTSSEQQCCQNCCTVIRPGLAIFGRSSKAYRHFPQKVKAMRFLHRLRTV